ncbi:MAG: hypothetical protein ACYS7M_16105, partial [Planctomycetota bacterium]
KDPAAYQEKLVSSYWYQTKCPVMGEEINPKVFITLAEGRKIFFCCKGCDKKLRQDPAKYLPKLQAQGIKIDAAMLGGGKETEKAGPGPGPGQ